MTRTAKNEIMESVSKETATQPPTDRQFMCNDDLLRLLADQRGCTVSEMAAYFHVSTSVIRKRLRRLIACNRLSKKVVTKRSYRDARSTCTALRAGVLRGWQAQKMKELPEEIRRRGRIGDTQCKAKRKA